MWRAGYGLAGPGLGVDRAAARDRRGRPARARRRARRTSGVTKFRVPSSSSSPQRPQLREAGALLGVLLGGRWSAVAGSPCGDGNPRGYGRRSWRPSTRRTTPSPSTVMTDPYPVYRELRARHRVVPLPEYDAFALTALRRRVAVLTDRDRFSIVEGPVFHRQALLRHHDGPPDTAVRRPAADLLDARPARAHAAASGAARAVPTARGRSARGRRCAQLAAARLDALADRGAFDVRHDYASPVAAQVAALQLGFPVEDAELLVGWVNAFVEREPDVRRDQRRGQGGARGARRLPRASCVAERRATARRRAARPHRRPAAPTPAPTARSTTPRSRRSWRRSSSVAPRPCPRPWPVALRALARARAARRAGRGPVGGAERVRGDAPPPTAAAVRRAHRRRRHRGRGRPDARGPARRPAADLRQPRRARVHRARVLRLAPRGWTVTSGSGTACTCASVRTSPGSKVWCWCRSCWRASRTTRSSRPGFRARCRNSTWDGPGCRSAREGRTVAA